MSLLSKRSERMGRVNVPSQRGGDITEVEPNVKTASIAVAAKFICLGSLCDARNQSIREGAVMSIRVDVAESETQGTPSRRKVGVHCNIDLVVGQTGDQLARPTWYRCSSIIKHEVLRFVLGHSTSVNVLSWSAAENWSKGEQKCSRTTHGFYQRRH